MVRGGKRTFLYLHKNTIEGTEKIEGQTNKHEQSLGLTKSRGRYATLCIPDSIYGLTLAWVTSENSTKLLESDSSWLTLAGPYPMLPRLSAPVSGVDCPCPWFYANPLLLASLLSSRQLPSAGSRRQLPSAGSRRQLSPAVQRQLPSVASPSHFRIRRDFMSKNPLSGFAPKQTIESSALAAQPHSATRVVEENVRVKCSVRPGIELKTSVLWVIYCIDLLPHIVGRFEQWTSMKASADFL